MQTLSVLHRNLYSFHCSLQRLMLKCLGGVNQQYCGMLWQLPSCIKTTYAVEVLYHNYLLYHNFAIKLITQNIITIKTLQRKRRGVERGTKKLPNLNHLKLFQWKLYQVVRRNVCHVRFEAR